MSGFYHYGKVVHNRNHYEFLNVPLNLSQGFGGRHFVLKDKSFDKNICMIALDDGKVRLYDDNKLLG